MDVTGGMHITHTHTNTSSNSVLADMTTQFSSQDLAPSGQFTVQCFSCTDLVASRTLLLAVNLKLEFFESFLPNHLGNNEVNNVLPQWILALVPGGPFL